MISKDLCTHLYEHLTDWSMKGSEILAACNNMSDLPENKRKIFIEKIDPNQDYATREELVDVLELS